MLGAAGAGKTFTAIGDTSSARSAGLLPRLAEALLARRGAGVRDVAFGAMELFGDEVTPPTRARAPSPLLEPGCDSGARLA